MLTFPMPTATPSSIALCTAASEVLVPILVDHGADVNAIDQSMHRPLTYALGMDDNGPARYLKAHGAHE